MIMMQISDDNHESFEKMFMLAHLISVNLVVMVMVHRWSASDGGDDNDEHSRSTVNPDKDW